MSDQFRTIAQELIKSGTAEIIIGYRTDAITQKPVPFVAHTAEDCAHFVLNDQCVFNLAVYLTKKEIAENKKVAVVLGPTGIRTVVVLAQEKQIDPALILVIPWDGVQVQVPIDVAQAASQLAQNPAQDVQAIEAAVQFAQKPTQERWDFFKNEFLKCIKCYACRASCPLCYCSSCIVEKNQPQWISPCAHEVGNYSWNITRAFHLAARCTGCGNCERACPVDIPLSLINARLEDMIKSSFDFVSGQTTEPGNAMLTFLKDDKDGFIL